MSKKLSARDSHSTTDTHDHSELTATDVEQSAGVKKRGLDVSILTSTLSQALVAGTDYDTIDITYPTTTKEVYTYTLSTASIRVVTVDYVDSTKDNILKVVYS